MKVRRASIDDYPAFARFFVELAVPDPVPSREAFAADYASTAIFVEEDGALVGYGNWMGAGDHAHVRHVVTDPAARRRGVGRVIMEALAERARAAGLSRWQLYVKEDNAAACRLYERCGMRMAQRSSALELDWADVARLPPSGRGLRPLEPRAALGVDARELERWSADDQVCVVCVADGEGRVAGLARYAPAFPGARPFVVDSVDAARPLLDAIARHRHFDHAHLALALDGQQATVDALLAAGARVRLALLRYEGAL